MLLPSNSGLDVRHSTWYLDSKTFGQVWVGKTAPAAEGITEINLAQTGDVAKYSDVEDTGLGLRVRARRVLGRKFDRMHCSVAPGHSAMVATSPVNRNARNLVKYVTPEFGGFVATAAMGRRRLLGHGSALQGRFRGLQAGRWLAYGNATTSVALTPTRP